MAKVSITEAIKLAGVSRSTFYTSYIKQGRVTVSSTPDGKKYIETSELLRVFGTLQPNTPAEHPNSSAIQPTEQYRTPPSNTQNTSLTGLEIEIGLLKQQLQESKEREKKQEQDFANREHWYQSQIHNLTDTMKLLEAPKQVQPVYPRLWWQFWK